MALTPRSRRARLLIGGVCLLVLAFSGWRIANQLTTSASDPGSGDAAGSAARDTIDTERLDELRSAIMEISQQMREPGADRSALMRERRALVQRTQALRRSMQPAQAALPKPHSVPALAAVDSRLDEIKEQMRRPSSDRAGLRDERLRLEMRRLRYLFEPEAFAGQEVVSIEVAGTPEGSIVELVGLQDRLAKLRSAMSEGEPTVARTAELRWLTLREGTARRLGQSVPWWLRLAPSKAEGSLGKGDAEAEPLTLAVVALDESEEAAAMVLAIAEALGRRGEVRLLNDNAAGDVAACLAALTADELGRVDPKRLGQMPGELVVGFARDQDRPGAGLQAVIGTRNGEVVKERPWAIDPEDGVMVEAWVELLGGMSAVATAGKPVCVVPTVVDLRAPIEGSSRGDGVEALSLALSRALSARGVLVVGESMAEAMELGVLSGTGPMSRRLPWRLRALVTDADSAAGEAVWTVGLTRVDGASRIGRVDPSAGVEGLASWFSVATRDSELGGRSIDLAEEHVASAERSRAQGQWREALREVELGLLHEPRHMRGRRLALTLWKETMQRFVGESSYLSQSQRAKWVSAGYATWAHHADAMLRQMTWVAQSNRLRLESRARLTYRNDLQALQDGCLPPSYGLIYDAAWELESDRFADELRRSFIQVDGELVERHLRRLLLAIDRGHIDWRTAQAINPFDEQYRHLGADSGLSELQLAYGLAGYRWPSRDLSDYWFRPHTHVGRERLVEAIDRYSGQAVVPAKTKLVLEMLRADLHDAWRGSDRDWSVPSTMPPGTPAIAVRPVPGRRSHDQDDAELEAMARAIQHLPKSRWRSIDLPPPHPLQGAWGIYWSDMSSCGEHGDLIVRPFQVFLYTPEGDLELLLAARESDVDRAAIDRSFFYQASYDGRHVWALLPGDPGVLFRVDPVTRQVRRFDAEDGLRPSAGGGSVVAVGAGRVVVSASTANDTDATAVWSTLFEDDGQDGLTATTLYEAKSHFVENELGLNADAIGKSYAFVHPDDPARRAVMVPQAGIGKSVQGIVFWHSDRHWLGLDPDGGDVWVIEKPGHADLRQSLRTPHDVHFQGVSTYGTLHLDPFERQLRLTALDTMPDTQGTNSVLLGGWQLRLIESTLFGTPRPGQRMRRLVEIEPDDSGHFYGVDRFGRNAPTLHASAHHGVLAFYEEHLARLIDLPDDLDRRYDLTAEESARRVEHNWTYHNKLDWVRDWLRVTQGKAAELAESVGRPMPTEFERWEAQKTPWAIRHGGWIGYSTHTLGTITPDDLLPMGQGPYPVEYHRGLHGRPADHRSLLYLKPPDDGDAPTHRLVGKFAPPVVPLPAGSVRLGAPAGSHAFAGLSPAYDATFEPGLSMAVTELTELQYERVMDPAFVSRRDPYDKREMAWTAKTISHQRAIEFCRRLSELTGQHWRLPTEAEWEYACRAGSTTAYANGDEAALLDRIAVFNPEGALPENGRIVKVRQRASNAWGLYDMHGGLAEWVVPGPPEATHPDTRGMTRILRGGAWFDDAERCRSTSRRPGPDRGESFGAGLRVVLDQRQENQP